MSITAFITGTLSLAPNVSPTVVQLHIPYEVWTQGNFAQPLSTIVSNPASPDFTLVSFSSQLQGAPTSVDAYLGAKVAQFSYLNSDTADVDVSFTLVFTDEGVPSNPIGYVA